MFKPVATQRPCPSHEGPFSKLGGDWKKIQPGALAGPVSSVFRIGKGRAGSNLSIQAMQSTHWGRYPGGVCCFIVYGGIGMYDSRYRLIVAVHHMKPGTEVTLEPLLGSDALQEAAGQAFYGGATAMPGL